MKLIINIVKIAEVKIHAISFQVYLSLNFKINKSKQVFKNSLYLLHDVDLSVVNYNRVYNYMDRLFSTNVFF